MPEQSPFRARIPFPDPDFPLRTSHIAPLQPRFGYLHCHPEYEIAYVPQDHGAYLIQDEEIPIEPGDVFIVNANDVHQPILKGQRNHGALVTYFRGALYGDPEENAQWLEPFVHASEVGFNKLPADEELRTLLRRLHDAADPARKNWKIVARGLITHVLSITAHLFAEHCARTRAVRRVAKVHRFSAVIAHINEHLAGTLEASTLYRIAGLSHSRFCEEFRATFGMSLVRYIQVQRVKRAKRLLRSTAMSVTEVAFTSGFGTSSRFNALFKQEVGQSPTQFRRRLENSQA